MYPCDKATHFIHSYKIIVKVFFQHISSLQNLESNFFFILPFLFFKSNHKNEKEKQKPDQTA